MEGRFLALKSAKLTQMICALHGTTLVIKVKMATVIGKLLKAFIFKSRRHAEGNADESARSCQQL